MNLYSIKLIACVCHVSFIIPASSTLCVAEAGLALFGGVVNHTNMELEKQLLVCFIILL